MPVIEEKRLFKRKVGRRDFGERKIMNIIWCAITLISVALMIIGGNGGQVLTTLTGSGTHALEFCTRLAALNCVWCGIIRMAEDAGVIGVLSGILGKPVRKLFGNIPDKAAELVTLSIAANVSGLSGGATPAAVGAIKIMDSVNDSDSASYPMTMLFVINACGLSVIPATVIGMRASAGAAVPADIVLPNFLASAVTTAAGILLVGIFGKKQKTRTKLPSPLKSAAK